MKTSLLFILFIIILIFSCNDSDSITQTFEDAESITTTDFYTPEYYSDNSSIKSEIDNFVAFVHKVKFQNPFSDSLGVLIEHTVPSNGEFCAEKNGVQNHPAVDLHPAGEKISVNIFASHDGVVKLFRDAPKYRDCISITKDIFDDNGKMIGKLVTIYGHLDLTNPILQNGVIVKKGELIENKLYSGTVGGPHLHFEVRYYRPTDTGLEEFYGLQIDGFTVKSSSGYLGYWDPNYGYGFGNPQNHNLELY